MHSNRLVVFTDGDAAVLAEVVAEVEKTKSLIAAAQAAQTRALARAGELARVQALRSRRNVRDHDMALRVVAAEIAQVTRVADRSVQRQIGDAATLVEDYPLTLQAWEAGRSRGGMCGLSLRTVRIFLPKRAPTSNGKRCAGARSKPPAG